jgi:hemin uptake protein HemP
MNPPDSFRDPRSDGIQSPESPDAVVQRSLSNTPKYRYADLSCSGAEVLIEHEGQIYRLRTTRNGKLILMK